MANLLHLEDFRRMIGYQPYHFWQQSNQKMAFGNCNSLVKEYAWLSGESAGRDDLRRSIARAEKKLSDELHYFPAPKDITEEIYIGCLVHNPIPYLLPLKYGYVNLVGTPVWNQRGSIQCHNTDANNDTVNDTGTATFVTGDIPYSNLADLQLAFLTTDIPIQFWFAAYKPENWLLPAPPPVEIAPDTFTFYYPSWASMRPALYEGLQAFNGYDPGISGVDSSSAYDPDLSDNFPVSLNVIEKTYTALNQVTLIYDNAGVETSYTIPCSIADKKNGLLALSIEQCFGYGWQWTCTCNFAPRSRRIVVNYNSGQELENWRLIIGRYALAELQRQISACESANREVKRWQNDLARAGGVVEEQFKLSDADLNCPFGTRAGAIYAWNEVKDQRLLRAINATGYY